MRFAPSIVTVLTVAFAPLVAAQEKGVYLGLGPSSYDLSGTGSTRVGTARYTTRVTGPLYVEAGAVFFSYPPAEGGGESAYLFPEISAMLRVPRGDIRPYLVAGAGFTVAMKGEGFPGGGKTTLHIGAGTDLVFSNVFAVRADYRVRAVDPWGAVTADFTFGPLLRF